MYRAQSRSCGRRGPPPILSEGRVANSPRSSNRRRFRYECEATSCGPSPSACSQTLECEWNKEYVLLELNAPYYCVPDQSSLTTSYLLLNRCQAIKHIPHSVRPIQHLNPDLPLNLSLCSHTGKVGIKAKNGTSLGFISKVLNANGQ